MKIKVENFFAFMLIALMLSAIGFTLYRQAVKSDFKRTSANSDALEVFAAAASKEPNDSFLDLLD